MPDDDGFLEFRLQEGSQNPWDEGVSVLTAPWDAEPESPWRSTPASPVAHSPKTAEMPASPPPLALSQARYGENRGNDDNDDDDLAYYAPDMSFGGRFEDEGVDDYYMGRTAFYDERDQRRFSDTLPSTDTPEPSRPGGDTRFLHSPFSANSQSQQPADGLPAAGPLYQPTLVGGKFTSTLHAQSSKALEQAHSVEKGVEEKALSGSLPKENPFNQGEDTSKHETAPSILSEDKDLGTEGHALAQSEDGRSGEPSSGDPVTPSASEKESKPTPVTPSGSAGYITPIYHRGDDSGTPHTPKISNQGTPAGVTFGELKTPDRSVEAGVNASGSKASHSRSSSHYEYHQGPTGEIGRTRVYDDSGLPVDNSDDEENSWQPMQTVGSYEIYDDKNNLLVEQATQKEVAANVAASGYTRVAQNDDAASINSLDDKTDYLFDAHKATDDIDADFQMAATKSMLTEQQKIAYAGLCRLGLAEMGDRVRNYGPKAQTVVESLQKWGTKAILRLYSHLGLNNDEQLMIESLAAHQVLAEDLSRNLKAVQKVEDNGHISEEENIKGATVEELHEDTQLPDQSSMEVDVRWTVMCDLFLVLLGDGSYDARSRTLLTLVGSKLDVSAIEVAQFERKVTDVLQLDDNTEQDWTEKDIIEARRRKALRKKYAFVGIATVGGGLVIGLSAGLLAPVVGAGLAGALGTIGITGTSGFLAGAGGTAIITTASTAIGAHVGSRSMRRRVGHVKTFEFRPIFNNNRVNLVITVSGWMTGTDDDVRLPFSTIDPVVGDVFSVLWEPEMMRSLGQTINILATEALTLGVQQILAATILTTLLTSLQAPMWLAKLSYLVDNPWSVSLDRAWAAGLILADTLMQRNMGERPATLVGYSLGARVIYSCLTQLARHNAFGLVQDVYLFGTPVFYSKKKFAEARAVVSGRYINGYSHKDWILAFLFPGAKRYGMVLGLDRVPDAETEALGIENIDVSETVDGHMNYRAMMPKLLKQCGWLVLSEEFDEIDDPDPDKLREKQRKLLNDLDTAQPQKKSGFFSSWKFDWMQRAKTKPGEDSKKPVGGGSDPDGIFDIDAIRQEMGSLQPHMVFDAEEEIPDESQPKYLPPELEGAEPEAPLAALDYDDPYSPRPEPPRHQAPPAYPGSASVTSDIHDPDTKPQAGSKQPKMEFYDLD